MSIQRQFLDWTQPALHRVADYLLEKFTTAQAINLSGVVLVLPGALAGRRLVEILVQRASETNRILQPPQITTVGNVPELLYPLKQPFADELTQQLAWAETLRDFDQKKLAAVIPYPPNDGSLIQWREYGVLLRRTHRELTSDGLDFADVVNRGESLEGFTEKERWQVLSDLQQNYLARLDSLELWDKQTARLFAIEHQECVSNKDLIFIGTVDMNHSLRKMLDQADASGTKITSLISAPEELADRFDSHGCLKPEKWANCKISVNEERIHLVDSSSDQADQVARCLAEAASKYGPDQITIGMPNEQLVPEVQRVLLEHDVKTRFGIGDNVTDSLPCRLIQAISEFASTKQYTKLTSLVRHPDVLSRLSSPTQALQQLDRIAVDKLPGEIDTTSDYLPEALQEIAASISAMTDPFNAKPQPLSKTGELIGQVLSAAYGDLEVSGDSEVYRNTLLPCKEISQTINQWSSVPTELEPTLSIADAVGLLFSSLQSATIPPESDADSIEILGWLELALDDAPCLILTSFNEEYVPSSDPADMFLPNQLRQMLSLEDDSRRYARDAYAFQVMLNSRKTMDVIVAKRSSSGEPLAPSRLLFACESAELPARVARLFNEPDSATEQKSPAAFKAAEPFAAREQRIIIPQPVALDEPIKKITASDIRLYLKCPYRYYLEKVLKLRSSRDSAYELDAMSFGNLAHDVLEAFGQSDVRNSTSAEQVSDFLASTLYQFSKRNYGDSVLPAVRIQIEQLRVRLEHFAKSQAARATEGWQIRDTELDTKGDPPTIEVDGHTIELHGRIDRVDYHPDSRKWAVLDYKTGDSGKSPERDHHTGKGENRVWTNVQLPFYRMLAPHFEIGNQLQVGYACLPKKADDSGFKIAKWAQEDFAEAEQVIHQVVRDILAEKFFPPADPTAMADDYSRICQDTVMERWSPSSNQEVQS
ncbi:MAG: hypothetical protein COA78_08080 [Blastopirellula sp.]|nr:MAG: hypothetical protein COA78_08080 [Blastopirellula sp.]